MYEIVNVSIGLALLMVANIILGSYSAWANGKFNKEKMSKGLKKSFFILVAFVLIYTAGWLNQDILVMPVGDIEVNVMVAIYLGIVGAYVSYAKQVTLKAIELIQPKEKK